MNLGCSKLWLLILAVLAGATASMPSQVGANLRTYVRETDPEFTWAHEGETKVGQVKTINLKLRSQVWRGMPWDHHLVVFVPETVKHPQTALLFITGGNPDLDTVALGAAAAPRLQAPLAILYNIPNQPLFDGKSEDDLIAHTFEEYLKSGDDTWPLLFPMVKSAVRAMDAVQELSRKEWAVPVEGFVVTGASKRGWTTYLTAAADRRVRGIAPMVFDNLNFRAQMPHQLDLWGRYSEQIDDYSRRGLQQQMETDQGRKLVSLVDPWYYRKQLTMPKLLIHGANDRYWATDATRVYWKDLVGDRYLLSVPNTGHGLGDQVRVVNTLTAFFHAVAGGKKLPELTSRCTTARGEIQLYVRSSVSPAAVTLWSARAPDLDFRPAQWEKSAMRPNGEGYAGVTQAPASGGIAVFAEAEYQAEGRTYTLTTPPRVFGKRVR
jgi:PhoPQ-activated pathogenicity-related protein